MVRKNKEKGRMARAKTNVRCTNTRRGRQKNRWNGSCKRDMESVGLTEEDVLDRIKWKNDIQNYSGDPR